MELGPLQKEWVKSLKEHPERQMDSVLGTGSPDNYQACCLGELLICYHRFNNLPLPFIGEDVTDMDGHSEYTLHSYTTYGLKSSLGAINEGSDVVPDNYQCTGHMIKEKYFGSLAEMNDGNVTWPQIAEFIENNPELVFTKSV